MRHALAFNSLFEMQGREDRQSLGGALQKAFQFSI